MTLISDEAETARNAKPLWHSGEHAPGLDGLRGVAILAVLMVHFYLALGPFVGITRYVSPILLAGWAGVDLFFVLSGFLITGILLDTRGSAHYFRNFYARRTLRIFPLYYGVLILTLLVCPVVDRLIHGAHPNPDSAAIYGDARWLWLYLSNIATTYPQLGTPWHRWFDFNHFWTLAIEEQFYLLWPAVVLLTNRRRLSFLCLLTFVIAIASRAILGHQGHDQPQIERFTLCRVDSFGAGGLLAILVRSSRGTYYLGKFTPAVFALVLLTLVAMYPLRHHDPLGIVRDSERTLIAIGFASLIALTLLARPRTLRSKASRLKVLRQLGKYSYGLYVWHYLLMPQFARVLPVLNGYSLLRPGVDVIFIAAGVAASCLCAWISWTFYEKPFLRLKRLFPNREAQTTEPPQPSVAVTVQ